jgi:DNA (cytosine-5)-methyltransferase 1
MVLRAIDLFAGAGGLSLGLQLAGIKVVGAIEWDSDAVKVYRHNIGDHILHADITEVSPAQMEEFVRIKDCSKSNIPIDLICGGPPCPGFSLIGRSKISNLIKTGKWLGSEWRHGFIDDPRNKLFLEFVKYVEHFSPKMFLMENVSGMFSSKSANGGPIVNVIKREFERLGYRVEVKLLSAASFGVPQERKRIIFMGTKLENAPVFPKSFNWNLTVHDALVDLPSINPTTGVSSRNKRFPLRSVKSLRSREYLSWMRRLNTDGSLTAKSCSLSSHITRKVNPRDQAVFPLLKSGESGVRVLYKDVYPHMIELVRKNLPPEYTMSGASSGHIVSHSTNPSRSWKWYNPSKFGDKMRRIRSDRPAPTLVAHLAKDGYMFVHPSENRTISVREAARLQSFPDSFDFSAKGVVSFTQQFRQIGNAVAPHFALALGACVIRQLGEHPVHDLDSIFSNQPGLQTLKEGV